VQTNRAPLFAITSAAALAEKVADAGDEENEAPLHVSGDDPAAVLAQATASSAVATVAARVVAGQSVADSAKLVPPLAIAPAEGRSWYIRWMTAAASGIAALLLGYRVAWSLGRHRARTKSEKPDQYGPAT
jgi:hypothetical protein